MKSSKKSTTQKTIIISTAIVLIAAMLTAGVLYWNNTYSTKPADEKKPTFSFDASKSPGWWSPGNYSSTKEDLMNYKGEASLPVSSLNAFKGEKGDTTDQCFVTASYQPGTIDIEKKLAQKTVAIDSSSSYKFLGTRPQTIRTPEGTKEYSINQYDLVTQTPSQYGNEFGFIQLKEGYISVTGVCPTADMLTANETALNAIRLNP